jgi:hypothetical protein
VIITRRYFNALAARSAFMSSIAANRANGLAWPTRPIHLVVPFAAGGPTDVIARIVGKRLSKGWGQQVLIENRPGGAFSLSLLLQLGPREPFPPGRLRRWSLQFQTSCSRSLTGCPRRRLG